MIALILILLGSSAPHPSLGGPCTVSAVKKIIGPAAKAVGSGPLVLGRGIVQAITGWPDSDVKVLRLDKLTSIFDLNTLNRATCLKDKLVMLALFDTLAQVDITKKALTQRFGRLTRQFEFKDVDHQRREKNGVVAFIGLSRSGQSLVGSSLFLLTASFERTLYNQLKNSPDLKPW